MQTATPAWNPISIPAAKFLAQARRHTAAHEAGHAVVYCVFGQKFERVTIESDGSVAGFIEHGRHEDILRLSVSTDVTAAIAGFAGVEVFNHQKPSTLDDFEFISDGRFDNDYKDCLKWFRPDAPEHLVTENIFDCYLTTHALLTRYRAWHRRVTEALRRQGTLSYPDVVALRPTPQSVPLEVAA